MFIAAIQERQARLARNPYNFHDSRYGGGMSCHDVTRARLEREGMNASLGAGNPYKAGTMAFDAWRDGRAYILRNAGEIAA